MKTTKIKPQRSVPADSVRIKNKIAAVLAITLTVPYVFALYSIFIDFISHSQLLAGNAYNAFIVLQPLLLFIPAYILKRHVQPKAGRVLESIAWAIMFFVPPVALVTFISILPFEVFASGNSSQAYIIGSIAYALSHILSVGLLLRNRSTIKPKKGIDTSHYIIGPRRLKILNSFVIGLYAVSTSFIAISLLAQPDNYTPGMMSTRVILLNSLISSMAPIVYFALAYLIPTHSYTATKRVFMALCATVSAMVLSITFPPVLARIIMPVDYGAVQRIDTQMLVRYGITIVTFTALLLLWRWHSRTASTKH